MSLNTQESIPLSNVEINKLKKELTLPWTILNGKKISYEFRFKTFRKCMQFVNKIADLAESESHHPDLNILYNKVIVTLWTHTVHGLSNNDFLIAKNIESLKE